MTELPAGMVTFLFTDIEGSTRLWEQQPAAMSEALVRHDVLLRAAIDANHGQVFKTIGDAFCAAFARPQDAVHAAVSAQRSLHAEVRRLRVRMAVHTGEAEVRAGDYFGSALNRVARLLGAGHGGQVLLSKATAELLRPALPPDTGLRSLGSHRLRDIAATETVFQLLPPGLPSHFPPLNTLNVAFRRGVVRASAVAGAVLLVMVGLTVWAVRNGQAAEHNAVRANTERLNANRSAAQARQEAQRADRNAAKARDQAALAERRRSTAVRALHDRLIALNEAVAQRRRANDSAKAERQAAARARLAAERERIAAAQAREQRRLAADRERAAQRALYAATMNLAQPAWEGGNVRRASELLEAQRPEPGQEDRRGFEWRYLWKLCQGDARFTTSVNGAENYFQDVLSTDGRMIVARSGKGNAVRLLDAVSGRELGSLQGTNTPIYSVAISPNSRQVAMGSRDGLVRLYDTTTQRPIALLKGHKAGLAIRSLAFSPDGKVVASGSADGSIKLWDVEGQREISTLRAEGQDFLAFSPDGTILASGTANRLQLWDPKVGRILTTLEGTALAGSQGGAFSPDAKSLAVCMADKTVRLLDPSTRQTVTTLRGHTSNVWCVVYSPDGRTLATGSDDDTIRLWDAASGRQTAPPLQGHTGPVRSIAFSPDGKTLASGSQDTTVRLWDLAAAREVRRLKGHQYKIDSVWFAPDGKSLVSFGSGQVVRAGFGSEIKIWGAATEPDTSTALNCADQVLALAYSPDGKTLALVHEDGTTELWDPHELRVRRSLTREAHGVRAVAFSPDGRMLATSSADGTVKLWAVESGRLIGTMSLEGPGPLFSLAFSPSSELLAGAGYSKVLLWDAKSRRLRGVLRLVGGGDRIVFSPDGRMIAIGGNVNTGQVILWDVAAQKVTAALPGSEIPVAFLHQGQVLLASGRQESSTRLWDISTQQVVATLPGQGSVVLSPDERTAAIARGNTITLWNLTARQEVATLKGHTGNVVAMAFSPDGSTLASANSDATVRLWHAAAFAETDQPQVAASGADRAVRLHWQSIGSVLGYHIYRGPQSSARRGLVRLTTQPVSRSSYTDHLGLDDHRPYTYGVAPVFRDMARGWVEGAMVTTTGGPTHTPPGWWGESINEGAHSGSADFQPATGTITLRAAGWDIYNEADSCYFMYRPVRGNFQITTKMLTRPMASSQQFTPKAGLMVRETLDAGARQASLLATLSEGLHFQGRLVRNEFVPVFMRVLAPAVLKMPITLRLTRLGNRITAEYSEDNGRSFHPAGSPLLLDGLQAVVYVGLAGVAHDRERITQAQFSHLEVQALPRPNPQTPIGTSPFRAGYREADQPELIASHRGQTVQLEWQPVPAAIGYRVYRSMTAGAQKTLVPLTQRPITATTFIAASPSLSETYGVAAVIQNAHGKSKIGPTARLQISPALPPPGWQGSSLDEGARSGSVQFHGTTGEIILRSSSRGAWETSDACYFMNRPVEGDFQITVKMLSGPPQTASAPFLVDMPYSGLMIREALQPGARQASLRVWSDLELVFEWRAASNVYWRGVLAIPEKSLRLPVTLRLTRRGDTVIAEYSQDEGISFHRAGDPYHFDPPLPKTAYIGLVTASGSGRHVAEAKFSHLVLQRR